MTADDETRRDSWSREQDRAFENALWEYPEETLDRWEKIASKVEGKSVDEIKHHYELLVDDVTRIESGHVPLPCYSSSSADGSISDEANTKGGNLGSDSKGLKYEQERRKGIAWTEEEHKRFNRFPQGWFIAEILQNFLLGLEEYGKGDWRSISRNSVVTRTPTQVASHAQKYFIRLNSMNKDRRRSSIHDITSVNGGDDVSVPKGPITGEINGSSSAAGGSSNKQTMGKPIGRPHVSVVGTPAHMPYVVRGSVPGQVVSGKRMGVGPMAYHTAAHR